MEPGQRVNISVIEPIEPAIERVKTLLFRPFKLSKWFSIGFCAWLAYLNLGGFNFNFNFPTGNMGQGGFGLDQVRAFFAEHFLLITVIGAVGLVFGLSIMVLLLWLASRGRFMFLHCVSQDSQEVKAPWRKYRRAGNSLLLFKLVAGFLAFVCIFLCGATVGFMAVVLSRGSGAGGVAGVFAILFVSSIMALVILGFSLVFKFTNDFVVPVMYLRDCGCSEGWKRFLEILSTNKGAFVLYIFFQIVISLAIIIILMAVMIGTCCCAGCFLAVPYIGTVLMLPIFVFKRAYSLYYLRQFGPDFDVFAGEVMELPAERPAGG